MIGRHGEIGVRGKQVKRTGTSKCVLQLKQDAESHNKNVMADTKALAVSSPPSPSPSFQKHFNCTVKQLLPRINGQDPFPNHYCFKPFSEPSPLVSYQAQEFSRPASIEEQVQFILGNHWRELRNLRFNFLHCSIIRCHKYSYNLDMIKLVHRQFMLFIIT